MKKPKRRPQNYPLVIPPDLREAAQEVADADRRFLHAQILVFIEEGVERRRKVRAEGTVENG